MDYDYPVYYSLPATMKDFEDTENTIAIKFEQLAKQLEDLRPHTADFSNITLPRNQIVSQLQKYLTESNEKEKILVELQEQIDQQWAKATFRAEIGDLRAQIDDMNQEFEIEKSKITEIEERQKPYLDEYNKLLTEIQDYGQYESTMKTYEFEDYDKEVSELKEQTEVFIKKKSDHILAVAEQRLEVEGQLKKELERKEILDKKPVPKTTAADLIAFKKKTAERIQSTFTKLILDVDSVLSRVIKPNSRMKGRVVRRNTNQLMMNCARKLIAEFNESYEKELKEMEEAASNQETQQGQSQESPETTIQSTTTPENPEAPSNDDNQTSVNPTADGENVVNQPPAEGENVTEDENKTAETDGNAEETETGEAGSNETPITNAAREEVQHDETSSMAKARAQQAALQAKDFAQATAAAAAAAIMARARKTQPAEQEQPKVEEPKPEPEPEQENEPEPKQENEPKQEQENEQEEPEVEKVEVAKPVKEPQPEPKLQDDSDMEDPLGLA